MWNSNDKHASDFGSGEVFAYVAVDVGHCPVWNQSYFEIGTIQQFMVWSVLMGGMDGLSVSVGCVRAAGSNFVQRCRIPLPSH